MESTTVGLFRFFWLPIGHAWEVALPVKWNPPGTATDRLSQRNISNRNQRKRASWWSPRSPLLLNYLQLVAGARYVPNRQILSIAFRSELIHLQHLGGQ